MNKLLTILGFLVVFTSSVLGEAVSYSQYFKHEKSTESDQEVYDYCESIPIDKFSVIGQPVSRVIEEISERSVDPKDPAHSGISIILLSRGAIEEPNLTFVTRKKAYWG